MTSVISGRVVDTTGAPVSGATVAVTAGDIPVSDIAALTDAGGHFRRSGLAPGTYTLDVRKTGQPPRTISVEVADGQQISVEVQLGG